MNILIASEFNSKGSGIARYQRELIGAFSEKVKNREFSIALIQHFSRAPRPEELPAQIDFIRCGIPGKIQRFLNGIGLPLERIQGGIKGFDLIHVLEPQFINTRLPFFVTAHDVAWREYGDEYHQIFNKACIASAEKALRAATHIISDSSYTASKLMQGGVSAERISVVPIGLSPQILKEAVAGGPSDDKLNEFRKKHGLPDRYVGYVGTCFPRKNVELIARCYALRNADALPPVYMVGPPPTEPARHGIDGKRIVHLGYVSPDDLVCFYRLASAVVFPSKHEGFGLPLIEAMAMKVPVVASSIPVFKEVAGSACHFFDIHGPAPEQAMCSALLDLFRDDQFAASLRAAGWLQSEKYSWSNTVQKLMGIYAKVTHG